MIRVVDLPTLRPFAAPAAASAILAGAAYCQAHGALSGQTAPLAVSLWWSASSLLPLIGVGGLAARLRPRLSGRPALAGVLLGLGLATAVALGQLAYAGRFLDGPAWISAVFRALPGAAGVALAAGLALRTFGPARPAPTPTPISPLPCDVALIRSAGNYLSIQTGGRETLIRLPLHEAARRLAPHGFVQAHRTALVNLARVSEARRERGRLVLRLDDGRTVAVGRAYAARVRSSLAARRSSQPL